MRARFLLAVLVTSMFFASAQSTAATARIDQWHGLKLALSTPDEALQALGKPETDDKKATGEFNPVWGTSGIYSLVTVGSKEKLRKVTYAYRRAIDGFKSVELLFFRDKLMCITLEPRTPIPFAEIQSTYGLELQLWNLSRYDQFVNRLQPDESPSTRLQLTGESGPLALLRTFYLVASEEGNVLGAFASTFNVARDGTITKLSLISKDYVRNRPASERPKTEVILK